MLPGLIVHVPDDGNPFNSTVPVAMAQEGWTVTEAIGAEGAPGATSIVTIIEEAQPLAFLTDKV
jgi:hypothetical protein